MPISHRLTVTVTTRALRSVDKKLLFTPFRRTSSAMRAFQPRCSCHLEQTPFVYSAINYCRNLQKLLKTELFRIILHLTDCPSYFFGASESLSGEK